MTVSHIPERSFQPLYMFATGSRFPTRFAL
jgi:hypothetical protein